jgi:hypothetical protein
MAGLVSATLEAFALPASKTPHGEHTYVTSSYGYSWECFGQCSNGISIASGVGNSFVAECLSHPRVPKTRKSIFGNTYDVYAGIRLFSHWRLPSSVEPCFVPDGEAGL